MQPTCCDLIHQLPLLNVTTKAIVTMMATFQVILHPVTIPIIGYCFNSTHTVVHPSPPGGSVLLDKGTVKLVIFCRKMQSIESLGRWSHDVALMLYFINDYIQISGTIFTVGFSLSAGHSENILAE